MPLLVALCVACLGSILLASSVARQWHGAIRPPGLAVRRVCNSLPLQQLQDNYRWGEEGLISQLIVTVPGKTDHFVIISDF